MKSKASHAQGMLLFRLTATQLFAIGTLKVKELVPYSHLHMLPNSRDCIRGTMRVRDDTISVIDMAAAVGYRPIGDEELKDCFIIVTDCQRKLVGFLVRSIEKITDCSWSDIAPPPDNVGKNAYITGVAEVEDKIVQLLDVELLLTRLLPVETRFVALTDIQREQLKPMNILLVDDSLVARKQLSDALDYMNIDYQVSNDGKEALNMMIADAQAGRPVQLLVSDIEMPGLDGYELTFEVRSNQSISSSYIILHTSLSSEISVSQARQVGANEALTKFDADELVQAMLRGAQSHKVKD